ncbi:MAG: Kdo hydroxylase family protein [Bryobacteraceae bacterium]
MTVVTVDPFDASDWPQRCRALERGNILYFPRTPFELTASEREFLLTLRLTGGRLHKNIAYRPAQDRVSGVDHATTGVETKLREVMRSYSQRVIHFTGEVLPPYKNKWRLDYASFRPEEEEGRDLPHKKRNDLLHVDAFPSRPTQGDLILRVFTNINPQKSRAWVTSEPFEPLARQYAHDAGLGRIAAGSALDGARRLLKSAGLPLADRSPYDRFMLGFHDYLKANAAYQECCAKYPFEFPPDSTWMVFTDVVPHSVLSGQYALEQTFIVGRDSLVEPEAAPVAILESLSGKRLAPVRRQVS